MSAEPPVAQSGLQKKLLIKLLFAALIIGLLVWGAVVLLGEDSGSLRPYDGFS